MKAASPPPAAAAAEAPARASPPGDWFEGAKNEFVARAATPPPAAAEAPAEVLQTVRF